MRGCAGGSPCCGVRYFSFPIDVHEKKRRGLRVVCVPSDSSLLILS